MSRAGQLSIEFWNYHRLGRVSHQLCEIKAGLQGLLPDEPVCSVVAPAYNEVENIVGTLWSISRNKTSYRTEVVVVDNGSADDTASIAREAGARVVICETKGIGAARHKGLLEARGSIVLTTDVDTVVGSEWINTYCNFFDRNEDCVAASGGFVYLDERGPNVELEIYTRLATIVHGIKNLSQSNLIVPGFNFGARRVEMLAVGGYDEALKRGEDTKIARELAKKGKVANLSADYRVFVVTSGRRIIRNGVIRHGLSRFRDNLVDRYARTDYRDVR